MDPVDHELTGLLLAQAGPARRYGHQAALAMPLESNRQGAFTAKVRIEVNR